MTKTKKYYELIDMRDHLTKLGYQKHIINKVLEQRQWSRLFSPTAQSGTTSAKTG